MAGRFFSTVKHNQVRRLKLKIVDAPPTEENVAENTTSPTIPAPKEISQEFISEEQTDPPRSVQCKHCKKFILEHASEAHIVGV